MAIYMAALGAGLGDLAVLLPVFQSLIDQGERVFCIARSRMQTELMATVPGLAGVISETEFAHHAFNADDRYLDFAAHPTIRMADTDWFRFKATFPATQINEFISLICFDFGITCDLENLKPLPFTLDPRASDKVLFIGGTTSNSKTWPLKNWLSLAQVIGPQNVLLIGKTDAIAVQQLMDAGLSWHPTPTIVDALAAVSSARAIVSVDTGLMHLSVHQGRPTLSFCNHASFWRRSYANLNQLVTRECASQCVEYGLKADAEEAVRPRSFYEENVWSEDHFNFCRVSEAESCIASIESSSVIEKLTDLLVTA